MTTMINEAKNSFPEDGNTVTIASCLIAFNKLSLITTLITFAVVEIGIFLLLFNCIVKFL